jgi:hypothetical protein
MASARSARSARWCSSAIRSRAISRSGYIMVSLVGGRAGCLGPHQAGSPAGADGGRDQPTPFPRGGGRGQMTHTGPRGPGGRRAGCWTRPAARASRVRSARDSRAAPDPPDCSGTWLLRWPPYATLDRAICSDYCITACRSTPGSSRYECVGYCSSDRFPFTGWPVRR